MSGDERSVATDALATLGTIINAEQKRDAIHLAVIPVKAISRIYPGTEIKLIDNKPVQIDHSEDATGIVDPFLEESVAAGQWFWMILKPRTITSLRHVWEHPDFPTEKEITLDEKLQKQVLQTKKLIGALSVKEEAVMWMDNYVAALPMSKETLFTAAESWLEDNDYLSQGSLLEGEYVNDDFWDHYEIITGQVIDNGKKGNFFSCSC
jgi:hypothetical protein